MMSGAPSALPMVIKKRNHYHRKPLPFHLDIIKCVCTKPLIGNLAATCSYVELKEAGIAFARLQTDHSNKSFTHKFNICVGHIDILKIKLSQLDNEGKRYLFFKITKHAAEKLRSSIGFDAKKFQFNQPDEPWIRFYFETEPIEHMSQILPFIRRYYAQAILMDPFRQMLPIELENVSVYFASAEYDRTYRKATDFDAKINEQSKIFVHKKTATVGRAIHHVVLKPTNGPLPPPRRPTLTDPRLYKARASLQVINKAVIPDSPTSSTNSLPQFTPRKTISVNSSTSSSVQTPTSSGGSKTRGIASSQPPAAIHLDDTPSLRSKSHDTSSEPLAKRFKPEPGSDEKPVVEYHSTLRNEHIPIYNTDLDSLAPKEFLNDTILSFYLAYAHEKNVPPEIGKKAYVFSSFFFEKLTTKVRGEPKPETSLVVYNRAKHFAKKINIFDKDFIVVPQNKSKHWVCTFILYPMEVPVVGGTIDIEKEQTSERKPCIIFLNSMWDRDGALEGSHEVFIEPLRRFLDEDYKSRYPSGPSRDYMNQKTFPHYIQKNIPFQDDHYNCGLFLLKYSEMFLQNPVEFAGWVRNKEHAKTKKWFERDEANELRSQILELIHDMGRKAKNEVITLD